MPTTDQLIHDTTIVTADEAGSILYDAALLVRDGRVAALGPSAELVAKHPTAEPARGRGPPILPGLANTHTHLSRVLARGIYEDLSPPHTPPFTGGLAPLPLPELTLGEERTMVLLGAREAIRSGTTLVLEESAGLAGYAGALVDTGLRLVLCERAWDRAGASIGQPGPFKVDAAIGDAGLARIGNFHASWHGKGDGRVEAGGAAWAPDMCSPGLLGRLRKLQEELGTIATVHLNQIWGEVAAVKEQRGLPPTEYLAREGFLSSRLVAAHCRCMTPQEEQVLGGFRASVAFNSAIAARRGLSPRADELERAGCLITLGTDNMAEDRGEARRTALFMDGGRGADGREPTPEEVLVWATRNGYRALGIREGGWLAPGNRADLILVDLRKAHLTPALRVVSCFVHQGLPSDVEAVMVDGRWIMRDGRVLTLDEPALVTEADRIARAVWRRLFERRPELPRPPGFDLGGR